MLLVTNHRMEEEQKTMTTLQHHQSPKLNVEAPVAGVFAAPTGVLSAPPNPEKVEEAIATVVVAAVGPKVKAEVVVLARNPKVHKG